MRDDDVTNDDPCYRYQSLPARDDDTSDNSNEHGSSSAVSTTTVLIESTQSPSFFKFFMNSSGPPHIMFLSMLYSFALGSIVGVVPAITTTQYAHVHHGLDDHLNCSGSNRKLQVCLDGNNDAQTAESIASFVSNIVPFFTSSLVGSFSDEVGRRREFYLLVGYYYYLLSLIDCGQLLDCLIA